MKAIPIYCALGLDPLDDPEVFFYSPGHHVVFPVNVRYLDGPTTNPRIIFQYVDINAVRGWSGSFWTGDTLGNFTSVVDESPVGPRRVESTPLREEFVSHRPNPWCGTCGGVRRARSPGCRRLRLRRIGVSWALWCLDEGVAR